MAHNHCCCVWRVNSAWLGSKVRDDERDPTWPFFLPSTVTAAHGLPAAPIWNFVEPTPERWMALLRPPTRDYQTLGSLRLGMKAAGAL